MDPAYGFTFNIFDNFLEIIWYIIKVVLRKKYIQYIVVIDIHIQFIILDFY